MEFSCRVCEHSAREALRLGPSVRMHTHTKMNLQSQHIRIDRSTAGFTL